MSVLKEILDGQQPDVGSDNGSMGVHVRPSIAGQHLSRTVVKAIRQNLGVVASREYDRVKQLPWRVWTSDDAHRLSALLTQRLKTENGEQTLRVIQAIALAEFYDWRGLLGAIGVGHGKTLITFLAPRIMGSRRPLLIIPASLREDTILKALPDARKHWQIAEGLTVVSYEMLSRAEFDLASIGPDLIMFDEAHSVRDIGVAKTKKAFKYLREHPEVPVAFLSGTLTTRSLMDYWHMAKACLGEQNMPLPMSHHDLKEWCSALDEKVDNPTHPGALLELVPGVERGPKDNDQVHARKVFALRLGATRGVMLTSVSSECNASILVKERPRPVTQLMQKAIEKLVETWETPDGDPLTSAMEVWRKAREIACGFYYKWDPAPPEDWMMARKAWHKFVYMVLKGSRSLFSKKMVAIAIINGKLDDMGVYRAWKDIEPTFEPHSQPVWLSDDVVNYCAGWMQDEGGIVWSEHKAFGQRLSQVSGVPYYGGGKANRVALINHKKGPVILSIQAHSTGRNLQDRWCKNLLPSPPPNGKKMEQLIGRTHRPGQESDELTVEPMLGVDQVLFGFVQAYRDAHYVQDTTTQVQKLCIARYLLSQPSLDAFDNLSLGMSPEEYRAAVEAADEDEEFYANNESEDES